MSKLIASVLKIDSCDSLHIVKFSFLKESLTMMSLDLDDSVKVDKKVTILIKPTNVAIGKNVSGALSHCNKLKCSVKSINNGKLLSSVILQLLDDITIESIITKESLNRLNLVEGDEVCAIIKASDISIDEVIDV